MVSSAVVLASSLLVGMQADLPEVVRLQRAMAYLQVCAEQAGYLEPYPALSRREVLDASRKRELFEFGRFGIQVNMETGSFLGWHTDEPGPGASIRSGSAIDETAAILTQFVRSVGLSNHFMVPLDGKERLRTNSGYVIRGFAWEGIDSEHFWTEPVSFDLDSSTHTVLSFISDTKPRVPANLRAVDSPASAWNKAASQYFVRHASTSWVELAGPLVIWLDDPRNSHVPYADQAPDFAACRANNVAWIGFRFPFRVFVNGEFHHWANGVVDGRTGTYVRTDSSGGFGSSPGASKLPWANSLNQKLVFTSFKTPGKSHQGKILSVRPTKMMPKGDLFLVSSDKTVFAAHLDRKAKRLRWSYKKETLEAELDSGTLRSLLKQASK